MFDLKRSLCIGSLQRHPPLDSIAVSVFADIFIELPIPVSISVLDNKIQITILILRRGAQLLKLSISVLIFVSDCSVLCSKMHDRAECLVKARGEQCSQWCSLSISENFQLQETRLQSKHLCNTNHVMLWTILVYIVQCTLFSSTKLESVARSELRIWVKQTSEELVEEEQWP